MATTAPDAPLTLEVHDEPPARWDAWLAAAGREAGLCQSTYWSRVRQRLTGAASRYLLVSHGGRPVAQLLALLQPPKPKAGLRLRPTVLEWLDGPAIHEPDSAAVALDMLLEAVESLARSLRAGSLRALGWASTTELGFGAEALHAFERRGWRRDDWATLLVDLTADEDSLFRRVDHSVRKGVKKCQRLGATVSRIRDLEDFMVRYYAPFEIAERAHGRTVNPPVYARVSFEEDREGYYDHFVVENAGGEVLAMLGMYCFNGVATEVASALMPAAFERKIPAQDLLHWEMMLHAKRRGCHTFNLAGVAPAPRNAKEAGIRHFKEKWGGRYVVYRRFEKHRGIWAIPSMLRRAARAFSARFRPGDPRMRG